MAVGLVGKVPGMTPAIYDAVNAEMGFPEEVPDGLLSHTAGPTEDGFYVADVWESREKYDRFIEQKLMPAFGKVEGTEAVTPTPPEQFEVHNRWSA